MLINGWQIYFIKRLFGKQRRDLKAKVRQLKKDLSPEDYKSHATVKLYTAIMVAIKEKITEDPFASHLVKKMGLPDRYRLFFRALQNPEYPEDKAIFIIWLGYPRKAGDKNDCYKAFTKMVKQGDIPESSTICC